MGWGDGRSSEPLALAAPALSSNGPSKTYQEEDVWVGCGRETERLMFCNPFCDQQPGSAVNPGLGLANRVLCHDCDSTAKFVEVVVLKVGVTVTVTVTVTVSVCVCGGER
eukprot:365012-Chlamydomonas_euryale.AAC.2